MGIADRLFLKGSNVTALAKDIDLLRKTSLLDPVWYRQNYEDLRDSPIDVARHYLEYGAREGRNPGPLFDTKSYLARNPDVAASGINPLIHYLLLGYKQGVDISMGKLEHPSSFIERRENKDAAQTVRQLDLSISTKMDIGSQILTSITPSRPGRSIQDFITGATAARRKDGWEAGCPPTDTAVLVPGSIKVAVRRWPFLVRCSPPVVSEQRPVAMFEPCAILFGI